MEDRQPGPGYRGSDTGAGGRSQITILEGRDERQDSSYQSGLRQAVPGAGEGRGERSGCLDRCIEPFGAGRCGGLQRSFVSEKADRCKRRTSGRQDDCCGTVHRPYGE